MTTFLVSPTNPEGLRTEEILKEICADIVQRMQTYERDPRPEARLLLRNNATILRLLREATDVAEANTRVLRQLIDAAGAPDGRPLPLGRGAERR